MPALNEDSADLKKWLNKVREVGKKSIKRVEKVESDNSDRVDVSREIRVAGLPNVSIMIQHQRYGKSGTFITVNASSNRREYVAKEHSYTADELKKVMDELQDQVSDVMMKAQSNIEAILTKKFGSVKGQ